MFVQSEVGMVRNGSAYTEASVTGLCFISPYFHSLTFLSIECKQLKTSNFNLQLQNEMLEFCTFQLEIVRVQSFLILGTRAEDFWQGYETFPTILWGWENKLRATFKGYKTILLEKIWMKTLIKD